VAVVIKTKHMRIKLTALISLFFITSCSRGVKYSVEQNIETMETNNVKLDTATFGAGCFWCVETLFEELQGVEKVLSGYSGGTAENPSYKDVTSGLTGHAEVISITFDSSIISYRTLLEVFWSVHDPTTLNRQGGDVGTQYRSVVFYHSEEQRVTAEEVKKEISEKNIWDDPIVTFIDPFDKFYVAEDYHQEFYNQNQDYPYCNVVIKPKVAKFRSKFRSLLKSVQE
jgi:peptide-methionine (S)-S-oxide reductase